MSEEKASQGTSSSVILCMHVELLEKRPGIIHRDYHDCTKLSYPPVPTLHYHNN